MIKLLSRFFIQDSKRRKTSALVEQLKPTYMPVSQFMSISFDQLFKIQRAFQILSKSEPNIKQIKLQAEQGAFTLKVEMSGIGTLRWTGKDDLILYYESPFTGVYRYTCREGVWLELRDGHRLEEQLTRELAKHTRGYLDW